MSEPCQDPEHGTALCGRCPACCGAEEYCCEVMPSVINELRARRDALEQERKEILATLDETRIALYDCFGWISSVDGPKTLTERAARTYRKAQRLLLSIEKSNDPWVAALEDSVPGDAVAESSAGAERSPPLSEELDKA